MRFEANVFFHKYLIPIVAIDIYPICEVQVNKPFVVTGFIFHQRGDGINSISVNFAGSAFFDIDSEIKIDKKELMGDWSRFEFRLKPSVIEKNASLGKLSVMYYDSIGEKYTIEYKEVFIKINEEPKTEFWIGQVIIPIGLFILGYLLGRERSKRSSKKLDLKKRRKK